MARKVTFDIPEDEEKQQSSSISPTRTQSRAPALSGMARSLQDAAQSSIQEISTDLIDDSEFQDRLALDDEDDIRELAESIDKQGQLIPILLSPEGGRYRIIYGRRRLAALRLIGKLARRRAEIVRPVEVVDTIACRIHGLAAQADAVRTHVGNVAGFVQALRCSHGIARSHPQLAIRLLLHRTGGERR